MFFLLEPSLTNRPKLAIFSEKSMIFMELNIYGKKLAYKTCKLKLSSSSPKYVFQKMSPEAIQILRMNRI